MEEKNSDYDFVFFFFVLQFQKINFPLHFVRHSGVQFEDVRMYYWCK